VWSGHSCPLPLTLLLIVCCFEGAQPRGAPPTPCSTRLPPPPNPKWDKWRNVSQVQTADLSNAITVEWWSFVDIFTLCKYTSGRYTWANAKNRRTLKLHGIAFEDAARIFEGPTVEAPDDRFDDGEDRIYAIGLVDGFEITVIYADGKGKRHHNNEVRRIVSAWRSQPHERRRYWQEIEI